MYSNWFIQQTMVAHRVDTACGFASLYPLSPRKSSPWLGNPAVGSEPVAHYQRPAAGVIGSTQTGA